MALTKIPPEMLVNGGAVELDPDLVVIAGLAKPALAVIKSDGTNWLSGRTIEVGPPVEVTALPVNYTGIPSNVRRITFMAAGISLNSADNYGIRLGTDSGVETTGYTSICATQEGTAVATASSAGSVLLTGGATGKEFHGSVVFTLLNPDTNLWTWSGAFYRDPDAACYVGGSKALAAPLTRLQLFSSGGSPDNNGVVNILFE